MGAKIGLGLAIGLLAGSAAGCFYPPVSHPPAQAKTHAVVQVPYDLTWDAVHTVIKNNDYKLQGDDPDHGIVEAEAHLFTLADADCGQMKSIAGRYDADPEAGASAVYDFRVEPAGPAATNVSVNATFSTPLRVPFHPVDSFRCVSRGTQEARLLKQVETTALSARRPAEIQPLAPPEPPSILTPGRPTLLRPDLLKKPEIR